MLERVDFFIREIGAIPVADTARIWSRCLNEINYRKNFLVREGGLRRRCKAFRAGGPTSSASGHTVAAFDRSPAGALATVRDTLGHETTSTTGRYLHVGRNKSRGDYLAL